MLNQEWLQNVSSLLSQVIELSDNNPALGNWLDIAERAAKQISNSLSIPYMPPFIKEDPDEEPRNHTTASDSDGDKTTAQNGMFNALKFLETVNNALKQFTVLEPFLRNLMKDQPIAGASTKSPFSAGTGATGHGFVNNNFLGPFLGVFLIVFLVMAVFRFR